MSVAIAMLAAALAGALPGCYAHVVTRTVHDPVYEIHRVAVEHSNKDNSSAQSAYEWRRVKVGTTARQTWVKTRPALPLVIGLAVVGGLVLAFFSAASGSGNHW